VVVVLGEGRWVGALDPGAPVAVAQARLVEGVNHGLFIGLVVTSVVSAILILFNARRLIRAT
jgi:hypothetical protein